ncbi:MAG: hypothetical protein IJS09_07035 [Treponema sp.]|nr:hypothetical protein [Treponema sp.]
MKKTRIVATLCALTTLGFVACKSAPKEEPAPAAPVVEEPQPEPEPEPEPQPEPAPEPEKPDFSEANKSLLEKLEEARNKALEADAKFYYPSEFAAADETGDKLKKDVDENPNTDYSADINDLIARYEALAKAAEAQRMKKRVDEMAFSEFDKAAYDAGASALDKFGQGGSGAEQLVNATAAYDAYKLLLNKGFVALAGRERNAALEAKKNADSVKAGVSQKETYGKAADSFKKADSSYVTKDIEGAYEGYKSAKETYTALYEKVSAARAAAQAAIERAKQRAADSANYATDADEIAPLSEQVKGIEDENAVLLEDDNLANPDDAVIDVNEGATAQAAENAAAAAIAAEEATNAALDAGAKMIESAVDGDAK